MKRLTALLTTLLASTTPALANEGIPTRWFEVEVILFTHQTEESQLKEEFVQKPQPITYRRTRDLLSKYHFPDISHVKYPDFICDVEDLLPKKPEGFEFVFDEPDPEVYIFSEFEQEQQRLLAEQTPPEPEPVPTMAQLTAPFEDPLAIAYLDKGPFIDFVTDRPDCLSTPWIDIPMVDKDYNEYHYEMFPRVIVAGEKDVNPYVHSISPANFKLREIYRSMRRSSDLRPILHTAWREPAGAEGISRATRLYAGLDFSRRFDFQGNPKPQDELFVEGIEETIADTQPESQEQNQSSIVDNIEKLLAMVDNGAKINYSEGTIETEENQTDKANPDQVREVDGLFRIYVDPFNYLHIDAEFNVRKEVPAPVEQQSNSVVALLEKLDSETDKSVALTIEDGSENTLLKNYHFKQTRRVITKEVHYFDHPFMGMIVQIRRYGW